MASALKISNWINSYILRKPLMTFIVVSTAIVEPVLYLWPLIISADIAQVLFDGGGFDEIMGYFEILIPIALIQVVLFFLSSFLNEVLAHRVTTDITYDLFETLQNKSLTYHDGKDIGDVMARATNDTRSLNMALNPGIRMIIATVVIWGVGLVVLYIASPEILWLGGLIFVGFSILSVIYAKWVVPYSTTVLDNLSDVSSITADTLSGVRDVKSYVNEEIVKKKFDRKTIKHQISKEKEGMLGAWYFPDLFVRIFLFALIAYALYQTYMGVMSFQELVLITTTWGVVSGMSEEMSWVAFITATGMAATGRLYGFIHEEDPAREMTGTLPFPKDNVSIEFNNVSFSYDSKRNNGKPVLRNINFRINENETAVIVGAPGSGKSTINKIIQRLYHPTEGEVRIGDIPINQMDSDSLRAEIATVEQEIFLFNNSILENIRFGRPQASLEEVIEAATLAQAHEFIQSFPDGYETMIGDKGVKLSGGQAQRLGIARALLINPSILLLDDASSAVDIITEIKIQTAITEILKTRTTIITTHRLAIIANADKIILLEDGEIVGLGTHKELIHNNYFYRRLFEMHYELPAMQGGD